MYSDRRDEIPLLILACFLAGFSDVANGLRLTGTEGEAITVSCSHSNAYTNTKYFCRGECTHSDVLITSKGPNTAKYRITDRGNDFDVTIYNLEVKDSGLYWCGIDRVGVDTYTRVDLTVDKKAVTDMPGESKDAARDSETVVYVGAGLGICFGVLVLVLLLFFLQRRRRLGASSADPDEKPDRRSADSPDQAAVIYSDVTLNRASSTPTSPRPSVVPPSEEVTYSTVRGADASVPSVWH
ncbi:CMRF35-like molecule 7 [Neosynchiropus ocellatus]